MDSIGRTEPKFKRRKLSDSVPAMNLRAGIQAVTVRDGRIIGRWSRAESSQWADETRLDHDALCDALEYLLNTTIDDSAVASFIRRFGISLGVPHGLQWVGPNSDDWRVADDFEDEWQSDDEARSWMSFQTTLRRIWDARVGIDLDDIRSIHFSRRDAMVPDGNGRFALHFFNAQDALLACLQTLPSDLLRTCANRECEVMPRFIADRDRRKYCSDGCFGSVLRQKKRDYEAARPPRDRSVTSKKAKSGRKR